MPTRRPGRYPTITRLVTVGLWLKNTGYALMGMGDAALTMAPFAKPIFNAMKRVCQKILAQPSNDFGFGLAEHG